MKKIITLILIAIAFALAAGKPADNKQFHEGEWWTCKTIETDEYGTVKNYTSGEGAKHVTSRDYQDGLLIRLVEYGGIEGYFIKTVKEQYFNSCKDVVEENYDVPNHFTQKLTFTYKYGKNCQILEKHSSEVFTDSLGKKTYIHRNEKYTYNNNKIKEKSCWSYNFKDEDCLIYTTITNGNKNTTYRSDKSVFKVETNIDEYTKIVDWQDEVKFIYKTFKESDTKYHKCNRRYLD